MEEIVKSCTMRVKEGELGIVGGKLYSKGREGKN
jgi:hypothetical protein